MCIDPKLKDVKHLIIRSSIETKSYYQQVVFYMQSHDIWWSSEEAIVLTFTTNMCNHVIFFYPFSNQQQIPGKGTVKVFCSTKNPTIQIICVQKSSHT